MRIRSVCASIIVFTLSVLFVRGCGSPPGGDSHAERTLPALVSAKALSRHYVEVEFASA